MAEDRSFAQDGFSMAHIEKALPEPMGKSLSFAHLETALANQPQVPTGLTAAPSSTVVSEKK